MSSSAVSISCPVRPALLALALATALNAQAQSSAAPTTTLDAVQVSGQNLSIREAIAAKREAGVVSDGIAADDIGSIPDYGVGEALQRVPGVSMVINNGRGEAQFMSLRGFNPDYNSVLIDGIALPSTETGRRIQSLDVIPASLVQRVDVYKSFNADNDSNAIGGIAALRTRSAFDQPGRFAALRGNLADWENERQLHGRTPSGQIQGTYSDTFGSDDRLGVVLAVDYFRRDSSSLDTAIDSYSYYDNGVRQSLTPSLDSSGMAVAPDRFRALSYDNLRQRRSVFGKIEYNASDALQLSLSTGVFRHQNDEQRRSQFVNRSGAASVTGPDRGQYAQGAAQVDANHFEQTRELRYAQFATVYRPNDSGHLDLVINRAQGSYQQDSREDVFSSAASSQLGYGYRVNGHARPTIALNAPDYYGDADNYRQSYLLTRNERSSTDTTTVKLDYSQNADAADSGWGLRAGLSYRDLAQRYDQDELRYDPLVPQRLSTIGTDSARICPYRDFNCLLLIDPASTAAWFATDPSAYSPASSNLRNSAMSDFRIDEREGAAYAMARWAGERLHATVGLRNQFLQRSVFSPTPQPLTSTSNYVQQRSDSDRRYLLPSLNLTWDLSPTLKLRLAGSRTLGLPNYDDIGQNSTPSINTTGMTISSSLANPQLRPRRSDNADLSLEWYPDRDAQLSLALFHKRISDEIMRLTNTSTQTDPGGLSGTYEVTTSQAINAGDARVGGVEFSVIDNHFDFLPGLWSHLGATANLTLLNAHTAQIQMADDSLRTLPALMESPKRSGNLSLLYDLGSFSARLSANYTGKQLISAATDNPLNDRYYDAITTYDAQLAWRFNSHLRLTAQGKNLSNAQLTRVVGLDQSLLRERLDNGRAYYLGIDYAF